MGVFEIASLSIQAIGVIIPVIVAAVQSSHNIKYYKILPGEYPKEVKLAEERKKNGDNFLPSYKKYINVLKQGRNANRTMVIKWERHFTKSEWTAFIYNGENFAFENSS